MFALDASPSPFLLPLPAFSRFSSSESSSASSGPSTTAYYVLPSPPRPQHALFASPSPPRPRLLPSPHSPSPWLSKSASAHYPFSPNIFPTLFGGDSASPFPRGQSISPIQRARDRQVVLHTPVNTHPSSSSINTPDRPRTSLMAQLICARGESPSPEDSAASSPLSACPSDVSPFTSSSVPLCRMIKRYQKRPRSPSPSLPPRAKRVRATQKSNNRGRLSFPTSSLRTASKCRESSHQPSSDEEDNAEDPEPSDNDDANEPMVTSNTSSAPTRTFPPSIPLNPDFPRLYVRFKVPTANPRGKGTPNAPRSPLDLYTPRLTQGSGRGKVGLCPLCPRSPRTWFSMKFSAFNYHMQYFHGISPAAALPFSPPTAFRTVPRPHATKLERNTMREGKCHRCGKWTPVEGVKNMETKVPELYWWKHAAACHGTSHIPGERDVFIEDAAYARALEETKPDDQTESEED